ncbi:MAG: FIST C-terminal domain-containing protein [Oscillospiraceae bacterium]|nr:FIST C-terminal domain-containing protein [Oscillospiraceae bacterium]
MIRMLTAYTDEIDDVEKAVADVTGMLRDGPPLLTYSLGILSCYEEFVESGVVNALSDRLPFTVAGFVTMGTAVPGAMGQLQLSLTVLTSDDVRFFAAASSSLTEELDFPLKTAYRKAAAGLAAPPCMMFTFAPLLYQYAGDEYVEVLDKISGGIPNFGALSINHNIDFTSCYTIFNGEAMRDCAVLVLASGGCSPDFIVTAVDISHMGNRSVVITGAQRNLLKEVDGIPLSRFLESMGLADGGQTTKGVLSIPFIIEYGDSRPPVARVLFSITPEGYGVCSGVMPTGARLIFAIMDKQDVLNSTQSLLEEAAARQAEQQGMLIFSCASRNLALGVDMLAEIEVIGTILGNKPYLAAYSAGEICPVRGEDGRLTNRFHNNTLVTCLI